MLCPTRGASLNLIEKIPFHPRCTALRQPPSHSCRPHSCRPHKKLVTRAAARERKGGARNAEEVELDFMQERPFFEPAIRSFALGLGSGILLELVHVAISLNNAANMSASSLSTLLPRAFQLDELDPLVFWDNVAAMASFAASYGLEVAAIVAVLKQFPNDTRKAARAIMQLPTLPKLLMPNLPKLRRAMCTNLMKARMRSSSSSTAALEGISTSIPESSGSDVSPPAPPISQFSDPNPPAASSTINTPSVLRGSYTETPPVSTFSDDAADVLLDQPGRRAGVPFPPLQGPSLPTPAPPDTCPHPQEPPSPPKSISPPPLARPSPRAGLAPGAWLPSEQDPPALRRERELWERRGFLKNFWYCAAMSRQLGQDKPLEVAILGRKVTLFRDSEGKACCLDNICPHRGAPLGKGWLKDVEDGDGEPDTCVVCPYHGWAFNAEGKVREVPSSPDQEHLPKRSLVPPYTVEEKGGFVWLFFGSSSLPPEERPPIPFVPELEDPRWQPVFGELEFDAPHWSVFDNAIDMAHIHYLHGDSFGNQSKPEVMDMHMSRSTFSVSGNFRIYNKPVNLLWEWASTDAVPVEVTAFLPSTSAIKITLGQGVQMITFVNTVPIDANRSVNRFCLIRNFAGWAGFDTW
ncbi:hypothetical protein DUNSADRAFT_4837 [Dunaliella salina]|uniref:Rieske domain-containing protein n=1 Tax=Dunaliella salina TaxID=3046 RepID=A0ABQ7GR72_DUNSA|nr:hypothetical protein DUNSADRAFT_4837 [Dunaliella salina]|eukprot:KAF5837114.1 hypothetical protein DUNSADRAFT_4837 [Dunaliella salina]